MQPEWIETATIEVVLVQMGYTIVSRQGQFVMLQYGEELAPVFLGIGHVPRIPWADINDLLETAGIDSEVFHAHLESL